MEQIREPEISPHIVWAYQSMTIDSQSIYDKGGKNMKWGKDSIFNN